MGLICLYTFLWNLMGPHGLGPDGLLMECLWAHMESNGSLWSLYFYLRPYGFQWVLMGPYRSLFVLMVSYASLRVLIDPFASK